MDGCEGAAAAEACFSPCSVPVRPCTCALPDLSQSAHAHAHSLLCPRPPMHMRTTFSVPVRPCTCALAALSPSAHAHAQPLISPPFIPPMSPCRPALIQSFVCHASSGMPARLTNSHTYLPACAPALPAAADPHRRRAGLVCTADPVPHARGAGAQCRRSGAAPRHRRRRAAPAGGEGGAAR
eukprot:90468-Chlamydomonas_euryale.AAC.1